MIGKISSADYGVNFGQGIKPSTKYKNQFASVIHTELKKATETDTPAAIRVNLLRAWEKLLQWEQKPFEFDLLALFKDALEKGSWQRYLSGHEPETTFFTKQDYKPRQDVIDDVKQALNKDDTLYVTGLIEPTGDQRHTNYSVKDQLSVPVEYANSRTINFTPYVSTEDEMPLDGKYMVFNPRFVEDNPEEFYDAIKTDLMNESLKKTADELWEKYGAEIQEAAESFNASVQNNDKAVG